MVWLHIEILLSLLKLLPDDLKLLLSVVANNPLEKGGDQKRIHCSQHKIAHKSFIEEVYLKDIGIFQIRPMKAETPLKRYWT